MIPKDRINNLILNYFIQEGYEKAAASFARDINVDLGEPEKSQDQFQFSPEEPKSLPTRHPRGYSTIKERTEIKLAILKGDITDAIERICASFPTVLDGNKLLHFKLLRLNLIEMIRAHKLNTTGVDESDFLQQILSFVRENLINKVTTSSKLLKELEVAMSLLCFNFDPSKSIDEQRDLPRQLRVLFDLSLRNQCYRLVNKAILDLDQSQDIEYTGPRFIEFELDRLEGVVDDDDDDDDEKVYYAIAKNSAPVEDDDECVLGSIALDSKLEQVIKLYKVTEQRLAEMKHE